MVTNFVEKFPKHLTLEDAEVIFNYFLLLCEELTGTCCFFKHIDVNISNINYHIFDTTTYLVFGLTTDGDGAYRYGNIYYYNGEAHCLGLIETPLTILKNKYIQLLGDKNGACPTLDKNS